MTGVLSGLFCSTICVRAEVRVEEVLGLVEAAFAVEPFGDDLCVRGFERLVEEFDGVLGARDRQAPQPVQLLGEGLVDGVGVLGEELLDAPVDDGDDPASHPLVRDARQCGPRRGTRTPRRLLRDMGRDRAGRPGPSHDDRERDQPQPSPPGRRPRHHDG